MSDTAEPVRWCLVAAGAGFWCEEPSLGIDTTWRGGVVPSAARRWRSAPRGWRSCPTCRPSPRPSGAVRTAAGRRRTTRTH